VVSAPIKLHRGGGVSYCCTASAPHIDIQRSNIKGGGATAHTHSTHSTEQKKEKKGKKLHLIEKQQSFLLLVFTYGRNRIGSSTYIMTIANAQSHLSPLLPFQNAHSQWFAKDRCFTSCHKQRSPHLCNSMPFLIMIQIILQSIADFILVNKYDTS
jgi:hypothetical protein